MSLLTVVNDACEELGLDPVTSVINNQDATVRQMLRYAKRINFLMLGRSDWPQLRKEYTFTIVSGQSEYRLPNDFDRFINRTEWDRDNHWELEGPLTPQQWQFRKSGITQVGPRARFTIKGFSSTHASNQTQDYVRPAGSFTIDPTPGAGEAGNIFVFEYISRDFIAPTPWVQNISFAAQTFCTFSGVFFYTTSGGTTGSAGPDINSASSNDGASSPFVTWTRCLPNSDPFYPFNFYRTDTDYSLMDEDVQTLGCIWMFAKQKNFQRWTHDMQLWENELERAKSKFTGASTLNLSSGYRDVFLGPLSIPDTGYGGV